MELRQIGDVAAVSADLIGEPKPVGYETLFAAVGERVRREEELLREPVQQRVIVRVARREFFREPIE